MSLGRNYISGHNGLAWEQTNTKTFLLRTSEKAEGKTLLKICLKALENHQGSEEPQSQIRKSREVQGGERPGGGGLLLSSLHLLIPQRLRAGGWPRRQPHNSSCFDSGSQKTTSWDLSAGWRVEVQFRILTNPSGLRWSKTPSAARAVKWILPSHRGDPFNTAPSKRRFHSHQNALNTPSTRPSWHGRQWPHNAAEHLKCG